MSTKPPHPYPPKGSLGALSAVDRQATKGLPEPLARAVKLLARLPGVGDKTAQRYALHLATEDIEGGKALSEALAHLAEQVRPCERCGHVAEVEREDGGEGAEGRAICAVCADPRRDPSILCVVARVQDLLAIERSGAMRGRYFVLGKLLSPLEGITAEELPLGTLAARVREGDVREVLVATPPSVDGEATALLVARALGALGVQVTRIASGVPHGGDLEFADQVTLGRAIEGRRGFG